jgi:hypothetical protein
MLRLVLIAGIAAIAVPAARGAGLTRLAPPPDGQTYFGFTFRLWDSNDPAWGDTRSFPERIADSIQNELAGKRPTLLNVWSAWPTPFNQVQGDVAKALSATGPGGLIFLDWTLTATTADNGGPTTKTIESGALDGYIKEYARQVKAYRRPVLIRLFGGEFNGSWWFGQSPWANPALTTADFVAAWRRVVDIFRQEGTLNASFAWVPNVFPPTPVSWVDSDIASYYPGDEYVDWVGADLYDVSPVSDLGAVYNFATAHGKPFFLAEWGVRLTGSTLTPPEQRDWLEAVFDYIENHPAIKAISYFNYDYRQAAGQPLDPAKVVSLDNGQVTYQANTNDGDTRLLAAALQSAFAQRIANPRYTSVILTQPVPITGLTARILSVLAQRHSALVRWTGSGAAYDVALRAGTGRWHTIATGLTTTSWTIHGRGAYAVRVRALDDTALAGPWTALRNFRIR